MPDELRVIVADDNPVVRAGLAALLGGRDDIQVVAEAADGRQAITAARRHRPDVVLLDVRMPGVDGLAALPDLVRVAPVMMLTYSREVEVVERALRLGADGYLVHGEFTAEQLVTAVRDVRAGRAHLSSSAQGALLAHVRSSREQPAVGEWRAPHRSSRNRVNRADFGLSSREVEVMDLIATGMSNQQIAATCFISEKTVKNHINRIFAKLHSASRSEAIAVWLGTAGRGLSA
ncbi:response regulator transcription factor [Streptomyces sannanensis]|uniref:Response regulator transcription factor n=1 Tax=Streptomyces sannanensis TaxID=285536 RepID=A0ABP6SEL4_9ACTN